MESNSEANRNQNQTPDESITWHRNLEIEKIVEILSQRKDLKHKKIFFELSEFDSKSTAASSEIALSALSSLSTRSLANYAISYLS